MKLTPKIREAVDCAKKHDNKLMRHGKSYWAPAGWNRLTEHFATTTITAMVRTELATVTKFKLNRKFEKIPMEITLTHKGKTAK